MKFETLDAQLNKYGYTCVLNETNVRDSQKLVSFWRFTLTARAKKDVEVTISRNKGTGKVSINLSEAVNSHVLWLLMHYINTYGDEKEPKYCVRIFSGANGYLNYSLYNGELFVSDSNESPGVVKTTFTEAEYNKLLASDTYGVLPTFDPENSERFVQVED